MGAADETDESEDGESVGDTAEEEAAPPLPDGDVRTPEVTTPMPTSPQRSRRVASESPSADSGVTAAAPVGMPAAPAAPSARLIGEDAATHPLTVGGPGPAGASPTTIGEVGPLAVHPALPAHGPPPQWTAMQGVAEADTPGNGAQPGRQEVETLMGGIVHWIISHAGAAGADILGQGGADVLPHTPMAPILSRLLTRAARALDIAYSGGGYCHLGRGI